MQEKLAILLSRKLSGEANLSELEELDDWIKSNPQDHYLIDIVQSYWNNQPSGEFLNVANNAHFENILYKAKCSDNSVINTHVFKMRSRWKWFVAAAIFLGLIIISALFVNQQGSFLSAEGKNEIAFFSDIRSHIILPDGTKVWLNNATRLSYDKKFNSALREVYLDGEAFFDVKKDKVRPFIVHTSDIDIRVIGTAFNVKSYNEEPTIEATLIHGSIQVTGKLKKSMSKVIMAPKEKLVFTKRPKKSKAFVDWSQNVSSSYGL